MGADSRNRVYAVEDQWAAAMDRGGSVDFFGSSIELCAQRDFQSVGDMQQYVDDVLSEVAPKIAAPPVLVRHRRGPTRAHYELEGCVIAVPLDTKWAPRETVLLHEIAHHLVAVVHGRSTAIGHGPEFTGMLCDLVAMRLGAEAALLLCTAFDAAGIEVGRSPLGGR